MKRPASGAPREELAKSARSASARSRRVTGGTFRKTASPVAQPHIDDALVLLRQRGDSLEQLQKLRSVTDAALAHLAVDDLMDELLIRVREALSSDTAAILLLDPSKDVLVARAAKGLEEEVEQQVRIPVGKGFAGAIAATRRPVTIYDIDHSVVMNPILREKGVRSLLGVPLVVHDELLGVLHVGTLTPRRFNEDDQALLQLVGDRVALAINAGLYERERAVARTLQRAFLPEGLPSSAQVRLAGSYLPAPGGDVGGDWYDAFHLPDGSIAVAVGDVVGRGLGAASTMAKLRNGLRAYAMETASPGDVLGRMDRLLQHLEPEQIATVFYGTIDPAGSTFRFANAGHVPPVVRDRDGSVRIRWVEGGPPLGASFGGSFPDSVEQLNPGALFVLYTDGLIERRDRSLDEGLRLLSETCRTRRSAEETRGAILDELGRDRTPDDDVTLLVIEVLDPPAP